MSEYNLLPCPFCGNKAHSVQESVPCESKDRVVYRVGCFGNHNKCTGDTVQTDIYATKQEAVDAWNTRVKIPFRSIADRPVEECPVCQSKAIEVNSVCHGCGSTVEITPLDNERVINGAE